ncbi:hypothetical protein PACTADRAFT_76168 [Pachysolen tannophilus NRRL Y-2460]|uniref:Nucleoporin NDC1 n=1 Tax=Pachysolen tannophilus NRRL Y-2460 TaxID=669874 RepID=A0A1E4TS16_PACTA|nr:hypothetical protein PACTADRAFT_76168 [Pachysolen tannophilus NRRL Y-2460]
MIDLSKLESERRVLNSGNNGDKVKIQPVFYRKLYYTILNKRMKFYIRLLFALSVLFSISMTFYISSFQIFMVPIGSLVIFSGFIMIKSSRDINVVVENDSNYLNFASQAIGELINKKFFNTLLSYTISSFCSHLIICYSESFGYYTPLPTRTIKPSFNDQFVYLWYHCTLVSIVYSIQHAIFLKDKLYFKYGVDRLDPREHILKNHLLLLKNALYLTVFLSVLNPVIYILQRDFIYKILLYPIYWIFNLNYKVPPLKFTLSLYWKLIINNFFIFYSWELINRIYDVYSTIGCIHNSNPISQYSNDPINTLLTGLRDYKNPLVRLVAFQELLHIVTIEEDPKFKRMIYNSHFKHTYVWPMILNECSIVIKDTCKRIQSRRPVLQENILSKIPIVNNKPKKTRKNEVAKPIFGSSFSNIDEDSNDSIDHYSLDPVDLLVSKSEKNHDENKAKIINDDISPIDLTKTFEPIVKSFDQYYLELLNSSIAYPFRPTLEREISTRILNPVNFGNCIIIIGTTLINEYDNTVTGQEMLSLLMLVYNVTQDFIRDFKISNNNNLISIFNELTADILEEYKSLNEE